MAHDPRTDLADQLRRAADLAPLVPAHAAHHLAHHARQLAAVLEQLTTDDDRNPRP